MFWADRIASEIEAVHKGRIKAGPPLIIRDEKTASGRVHVGSMRGAAIHGLISEVLTERGIQNEYLYEINDFDPMDGLPAYLDAAIYAPYMGKPLYSIPSPDGSAQNFALFYGGEFKHVITDTGFAPQFYTLHEKYKAGLFDETIKTALEHPDEIKEIYKRVSGSAKEGVWFPLSVICEQCGKMSTTRVTAFDGEKVSYECRVDAVDWTAGCGFQGKVSPYGGTAKLPWKVEWAAKFKVFDVAVEGAGKDHSTKGGSRDVADTIAREIYRWEPPFNVPYEFFLVGGKKMSSSKGNAAAAREIADLVPPSLFRLALLGKDIKQQTDFDPQGDTIPLLFDWYDRLAAKAWAGGEVDDDAKLFAAIHSPHDTFGPTPRFLPRFGQVAFLVQMPHLNFLSEIERLKGEALSDADRTEAETRAQYARHWLSGYAAEEFKYEIQQSTPEAARHFSDEQKTALRDLLLYIEEHEVLDGQELHTTLHAIRKDLAIEPATFFSALYLSILGKPSGPKGGWFLSVLDRDFLIERLRAVTG